MVEAIGPKPIGSERRIVPAATPAAQPAAVATGKNAPALPGGLARDLAATPPVDIERVARIKKAVADGTFPIYPALVADRLIALKMEWTANEPA